MRKLTLLVVAAAIALLGLRLIFNTGDLATYVLRDGLLIAALGALLFALNAPPLPPLPSADSDDTPRWPRLARVLFVTGAACAAAGGALFALPSGDLGAALRNSLWLIGIALFVLGAAWRSRRRSYRAPAYRWQRDDAGRFHRVASDEETAHSATNKINGTRGVVYALILILALAALPRLIQLTTLPAQCIGAECQAAVDLASGESLADGTGPLVLRGVFDGLTHALFALTGNELLGLRLASALIGLATLPAFFLLARAYAHPPAALVATLLLAVSPWHIWASRSSTPWITLPLALCLAGWTLSRALPMRDWRDLVRSWALAGAATGWVLLELRWLEMDVAWPQITMSWTAGTSLLLAAQMSQRGAVARTQQTALAAVMFALGVILIAAPPYLLPTLEMPALTDNAFTFAQSQIPAVPTWTPRLLLADLLHGSALPAATLFATRPLLTLLTATLAFVGLAALLRNLARRQSWGRAFVALLALATLLFLLLRSAFDPAAGQGPLLGLLPGFFLAAAVALDGLLHGFAQSWRNVLPRATAPTFAAVAVLLVGLLGAASLWRGLDDLSAAVQTQADAAIARDLSALSESGALADTRVFVPPAIFESPNGRLLAGEALASPNVHPLRDPLDLLGAPVGNPTNLAAAFNEINSVRYLIPAEQADVLTLLTSFHPRGVAQPQLDEESGAPIFTTFEIDAAALAESRTLPVEFTSFVGGLGDARYDALDFPWAMSPPVAAPFSAAASASLLVPQAGSYTFRIRGNLAPQETIQLNLDGELLLDTSLDLRERVYELAAGYYALDLRYESDDMASDWSITWQRGGEEPQVIGAENLYAPTLPTVGLLATYHAGTAAGGPTDGPAVLDTRKEPLPGRFPPDLPRPWSVRWTGQLAAPRAGEYGFIAGGDGAIRLSVDNVPLLDSEISLLPAPENVDAVEASSVLQTLRYLNQGWRPVDLVWSPNSATARLNLRWQVPGSVATSLAPRFFTPLRGDLNASSVELPTPPPLLDNRLGDDDFALSPTVPLREVEGMGTALPPLPSLFGELLWRVENGCGAGDNQLNQPRAVVIAPGADNSERDAQIFVADAGNQRAVAYDLDGASGTIYTDPAFGEPTDLALDPSGNPLLLDAIAAAAFRLDPASGEVRALEWPTLLYRPRGFDVDAAGNFYVAETGGGRVVVLTPEGELMAQFGGPGTVIAQGQPADVLSVTAAFGDAISTQRLWTITAEDGRLRDVLSEGSLGLMGRTSTIDGAHFAGLPDGSFFVTNPAQRSILYLAPSGQPLRQLALDQPMDAPTGLSAATLDSNVYLALTDSLRCTLSLWRLDM